MSKNNIAIKEGGISKTLTVDKLKTDLVGGGSCMWVPEDGTRLTTKYITENGTYRAESEGYYGYSEVTVNGIGTAKGTDGDGDDAIVTTGPNGELETKKLPSSIRVVTPPTKTDYADGETIDFSGMVVKAYLKTGGVWSDSDHPGGVIPISELILPVTTADISQVSGETATSDLITEPFGCGSSGKVVIGPKNSTADDWYLYSANDSDGKLTLKGNLGGTRWDGIYASASPSGGYTEKHYYPNGGSTTKISNVNQTYSHNGRTVNYATWTASYSGGSHQIKEIAPTGSSGIKGEIAWTMIFGTITQGGQAIPVQWSQPETGDILETSFMITVGGAA